MEIRLKIENDMSKAQETAILDKLLKAFTGHPDNYLTSLFSKDFVNWAEIRMSNDFPLDMMDFINGETADLKELREENAKVEQLNFEQESKINNLETALDDQREKLGKYIAELERNIKTEQEINTRTHQVNEQYKKEFNEMIQKSKDRQNELDRLSQEVDRLKVKLFDLIEGKETKTDGNKSTD